MKHQPLKPFDLEPFKKRHPNGKPVISGIVSHFTETYKIDVDVAYCIANAFEISGYGYISAYCLSEKEYALFLSYCAKFINGGHSSKIQHRVLSIIKNAVRPGLSMKPNRYDKMVQSISLLILEE